MAHWLYAALLPASVTPDTAQPHIEAVMAPLLTDGDADWVTLGGAFSGRWTPDYDPALDPANWRPCATCGGGTRPGHAHCGTCADAVQAGRDPATVLAPVRDRVPCPADLVPLPAMLDEAWRFPSVPAPHGWADPAGILWLDSDADIATIGTGQVRPTLLQVFRDLLTGRRQLPHGAATRATFDPAAYTVGLVDAHY
jgi:hypothetical protein